jgi:hypothetical protein
LIPSVSCLHPIRTCPGLCILSRKVSVTLVMPPKVGTCARTAAEVPCLRVRVCVCVCVPTYLYVGCWRLQRRTSLLQRQSHPHGHRPSTHQTAAGWHSRAPWLNLRAAPNERDMCVCVTTWRRRSDCPRVMVSSTASRLQLQPRACGRATELGLCTVYAVSAVVSPSKKLSDTQGPRGELPRWRPIMATMARRRSTSCYRLGQSPETSAYRRMLWDETGVFRETHDD